MCPEKHHDIPEPSLGILMFRRLLLTWIGKINKDEPGRARRNSHQAADDQCRSQSPAIVEDSNMEPSRMAANKRVPVSALSLLTIGGGVSNISS